MQAKLWKCLKWLFELIIAIINISHMKKIQFPLIIILSLFIIPSIAMASWWNPFTWFKRHTNTPIVEQTSITNNPIITENSNKKTPEKEIVKVTTKENKNTETKKKEEEKVVTPINTTPKVIPTQITTIPPVQNTTSIELNIPVKLVISDISFNSTHDSVNVNWETNINAESKILFNGKAYLSENGVSQSHSTEINNLEASHSYTGTITALANNAWDNKEFTFKTKQALLNITLGSQTCLTNSCRIDWRTNYSSDSTITITKTGQTSIFGTFNSENGTDSEHTRNIINLSPSTQYHFKINTTYNSESVETEGNFTTQSLPTPPEPPCDARGGACA